VDAFAETHVTEKPFGTRPPIQPAERRKGKREPLSVAVSLYSVAQSRVVLMLDVSPTGVRFAGQDLPAIGKDVLLKIDDVELFGSIVRSGNGEAAIQFDRPIGPQELEKLQTVLVEQTQVTMLHGR
jgi:hypothetical protein